MVDDHYSIHFQADFLKRDAAAISIVEVCKIFPAQTNKQKINEKINLEIVYARLALLYRVSKNVLYRV